MDDTRRTVAPVNQSVALVAQWWWKVPRTKSLVADVVNVGANQFWQYIWMDLCSWLKREIETELSLICNGWLCLSYYPALITQHVSPI